jgi:hypothetical protein
MTNPIAFNGYDDTFIVTIKQDDVTIDPDVITRVVFWIPGAAFADGLPHLADTDGDGLTLNNDATMVTVTLGELGMKPGIYSGKWTVFDAVNTNGLPWGSLEFKVSNWNSSI